MHGHWLRTLGWHACGNANSSTRPSPKDTSTGSAYFCNLESLVCGEQLTSTKVQNAVSSSLLLTSLNVLTVNGISVKFSDCLRRLFAPSAFFQFELRTSVAFCPFSPQWLSVFSTSVCSTDILARLIRST